MHGVGDEAGIGKLFTSLSKGGEILVPLDTDPFGEKYHWVNGRFGVSCLLMLAKA